MKVEENTRDERSVTYTTIGGHKVTVSVCEWGNGEGWDIAIQDHTRDAVYPVSRDDFNAIQGAIASFGLD